VPCPDRYEIAAVVATAVLNIALAGARSRPQLTLRSVIGAAVMLAISRAGGATLEEQGLASESLSRGVRTGLVLGVPVAVLAASGALFPPARSFYGDRWRIVAEDRSAPYEMLVRVPLATALAEEVIFRASLAPMIEARHTPAVAALINALLFGAWHVAPSLERLRVERPDSSQLHSAAVVVTACAVTGASSLAFNRLKKLTGSIVAPAFVHYAINLGGLAGGWLLTRMDTLKSARRTIATPITVASHERARRGA
jgi:uncharacterized protein